MYPVRKGHVLFFAWEQVNLAQVNCVELRQKNPELYGIYFSVG